MGKEEKYLGKALEAINDYDFDRALHYLKLTKSKDPEVLIYEIVCLIWDWQVQAFNKINKVIDNDFGVVYKIVAEQCLYFMACEIEKQSKHEPRYEPILSKKEQVKRFLESEIHKHEQELKDFLGSHSPVFAEVFKNSVLFEKGITDVKGKVILCVKQDNSLDQDVLDELCLTDLLYKCCCFYKDKKFADFMKHYKLVKDDDKFVFRTMLGVVLYKEGKYEEALKVLQEVVEGDVENNWAACKHYVYLLYRFKKYNEILLLETKLNNLCVCKDYILELKAAQAIKKGNLAEALTLIDNALEIRQDDFELILLKCEALLKMKELTNLDTGLSLLRKLSVKHREDKEKNEEMLKLTSQRLERFWHNQPKNLSKNQNRSIILKLCDVLLVLEPYAEDIKKLKIDIIKDFQCKTGGDDKLHLNDIITSLRLTQDTSYLKDYLAEKLIKEQKWERALYVIETVLAFEPDNAKMLELKQKALESSKHYEKDPTRFTEWPTGEIILCDANVWINKILTASFKIGDEEVSLEWPFRKNLEKTFGRLTNKNTVIITPVVVNEFDEHITAYLQNLRMTQQDFYPDSFLKQIKLKIETKKKELITRFFKFKEIKINTKMLENIRNFYNNRLRALEMITKKKIQAKTPSDTIRKLVKREGYLPETGDMKLLAEAIALSESETKQVSILTEDADFVEFTKDIYDTFKIKVYSVEEFDKEW